ncbi:anthranilate synthase component I, partial [Puniceibacterium confluentis]
RGRYSIIGMKPDLIWQCHGTTATLNRQARYDADAFQPQERDPLSSLRALIAESRINLPEDLPQAAAGLFGYLGYDMIRLVEHLPDVNPDPLGLPDAVMMRPSVVAVLDGVKGEVTVVSPAWVSDGLSARAAYAQAAERVMDAMRDLERALPQASRDLGEAQEAGPPVSNFTHEGYKAAVQTAKDYIRRGDIFQVVPSQRWTQDFPLPPFTLYRSLRRTNPSPFMFYFNFGGFQVIGASPEILVRVFGNEVTIRPIAGTRPRGATPAEDKANELDLLADKKELAEHLMLLDLGRNDTGKVSRIGTVKPTEQFIIERYSHVMHIVSNVTGELASDQDALSAFFAGMPAGTVSGAPKVRAMQIIDELEPEKRGIYGGGLGYFSAGGDMDMCIALRTAILKDQKLYIQAGGGVVYDSDPEAEYQETVHKSNAIRRAAADAARFTGNGNS